MDMNTFYGADVSRYQGTIDWPTFNPGASFVFIKAGGGDDELYIDSQFSANKAGARALGNDMPRGFYWFGGTHEALIEADYFVNNCVADLQIGEVLVLDSEAGNALDPSWCKIWLDRVQELTGVKPLIYMSASKTTEHDWSSVVAGDYGLWVADYAVTPEGDVPIKYWSFYAFHQYKDNGTFPGISGSVDTDAFFAEYITDFFKYGKQATVVTPVPPATVEPPQPPLDFPPMPVLPPDPGTVVEPTPKPTTGTAIDVVLKPTPKSTPSVCPQSDTIEKDVGIVLGKYNKSLVAFAGLLISYLAARYGANHIVKDAVLLATLAGVYQVKNDT